MGTCKIGRVITDRRRYFSASIVLQSLHLVDCVAAASKRNNNLTDNCSRNQLVGVSFVEPRGKEGWREGENKGNEGGTRILDKEMERERGREGQTREALIFPLFLAIETFRTNRQGYTMTGNVEVLDGWE